MEGKPISLADGNNAIRCQQYSIILSNSTITVPRAEFFIALSHFGKSDSKSLIESYLNAEKVCDELFIAFANLGLLAYQEAMYVKGRAFPQSTSEDKADQYLYRKAKLYSRSFRPLSLKNPGEKLND